MSTASLYASGLRLHPALSHSEGNTRAGQNVFNCPSFQNKMLDCEQQKRQDQGDLPVSRLAHKSPTEVGRAGVVEQLTIYWRSPR